MLSSFAIALFSSFVLTYLLAAVARRRGWCSPLGTSSHHAHRQPTPRLGGAAICFAVLIALAGAAVLPARIVEPGSVHVGLVTAILATAMVMFSTGLVDDWRPQSAGRKLILQVLAAGLLLYWIGTSFGVPGWEESRVLALSAAMAAGFWIVLLTNGFNLIDGLDGLAGITAAISCAVLFLAALIVHDGTGALLSVVMGGALLGFLPHNVRSATIFLGDCGSLFTGFLLGAVGLAVVRNSSRAMAVCFLLSCFLLPVSDTVLAVTRRFLSGRRIFAPDREHIHHRLLAAGLAPHAVVGWLSAVAILFGAIALCFLVFGLITLLVAIPALAGIGLAAVVKLRYAELSELGQMTRNVALLKPVIRRDIALRRAAYACSDSLALPQVCDLLRQTFEQSGFDGLEIHIPGALNTNGAAGFSVGPDGVTRYRWSRDGQAALSPAERKAAWRLAIDLVGDQQQKAGMMILTRGHHKGPVLVDVNLLLGEVADAVGGAMSRATQNAASPAQRPNHQGKRAPAA